MENLRLNLTRKTYNELVEASHESPDDEIIFVGIGDREEASWKVTEAFQIKNDSMEEEGIKTSAFYVGAADDFIKVMMKTRHFNSKAKKDLTMIFHTHPHGASRPSGIDLGRAQFRSIYVIYSPRFKTMNAYFWDGDESKRVWNPINHYII